MGLLQSEILKSLGWSSANCQVAATLFLFRTSHYINRVGPENVSAVEAGAKDILNNPAFEPGTSVCFTRQDEINLVERLLSRDVPGAELLRSQLYDSLVYPMNSDEIILRFQTSSQEVPYIQNVAVEASAKDTDGCRIEVLLHVKDGLPYELEFVKIDGSSLLNRPLDKDLTDFIVRR